MKERKLTKKQEMFCQLYVSTGKTRESYKNAYNSKGNYQSMATGADRLKKIPHIIRRIEEIKIFNAREALENCSVPINIETLNEITSYFGSIHHAKGWIASVISREALELGLSVASFKRGNISGTSRYSVLERAGFKCQACGARPSPENEVVIDVDHIIPFSSGGGGHKGNLQALCSSCNRSKGNRYQHNHNLD